MLEAHEGKKSHAYQDVGGKWHIGIGRNIDPSGLGLADDEIEYLLQIWSYMHLKISLTH